MADEWGCSFDVLFGSMSHYELTLRVVARRMRQGGTYDKELIEKAKQDKIDQEQRAYTERLRAEHYKRLGIKDPFR